MPKNRILTKATFTADRKLMKITRWKEKETNKMKSIEVLLDL